jgi:nucleotide-binding universal stress UspA family protein
MGFRPDGSRDGETRTSRKASEGGFSVAGLIICGVDDSESAKGAARVARGLSSKLGLGLVFLRVVESGASKEKVSAITERLERVCGAVSEVDNGARWLVDQGHPAERLVAAAEAESASMIVVGSTGPRSSLLGSISAEVSKRAPCPVVVVPPGADLTVTGQGEDGEVDPPLSGGIVRVGTGSLKASADTDFAGGIVRFGAGSLKASADTDFAGGIVRFGFGADDTN